MGWTVGGELMTSALTTGCVYGQYSSLDEFSYGAIRYVGMTGSTIPDVDGEKLVNLRLKAHLSESAQETANPHKVSWYTQVKQDGGEILAVILAEMHDTSRDCLGDTERDWIEKLGGPIRSDGSVVQLLNLTHGRDGVWWTQRDLDWIEATRQRMLERYATQEARIAHGQKMREVYQDDPRLGERLSRIQSEVQNRPEQLERNRQGTIALWQDPKYREKVLVPTPCRFCGNCYPSPMAAGAHARGCLQNPFPAPRIVCDLCGKAYINIDKHILRCTKNPNRVPGKSHAPLPLVPCPYCGKGCKAGAGLRAHVKWNHEARAST